MSIFFICLGKKFMVVKKFSLPLGDVVKIREKECGRRCKRGGFNKTLSCNNQKPGCNIFSHSTLLEYENLHTTYNIYSIIFVFSLNKKDFLQKLKLLYRFIDTISFFLFL